jgi:Ca2+-binding RTX toxin-like protein
MGWFSKFTDNVLGLDPNGGGIYGFFDNALGIDPNGGGVFSFLKKVGINVDANDFYKALNEAVSKGLEYAVVYVTGVPVNINVSLFKNPAPLQGKSVNEQFNSLVSSDAFNEQFYRLIHKDVDAEIKAGKMPSGIYHYINYGFAENRVTSIQFNEQFYRLVSPDVDAAIKAGTIPSAMYHYLNWGYAEKRATSFQFNETFYRLIYKDVDAAIKAGTQSSALQHYINHGYAEGRSTSLSFDEQYYRSANPDVDAEIKAGKMPSAIHHYINHGYAEGRVAQFNTPNSNASLWGTSNSDILQGSNGNNYLNGGSGNDTLNGGAGIDTLMGGVENDIYIVDSATDIIIELANQGTDTIQSSVTFSLLNLANIENLTLTGTAAINGTGNAGNNILTGNSANNILDGKTGADTLIGGLGNDSYLVENVGDQVIETSNLATEIDSVYSIISYTLGANLENLNLLGNTAINGMGNTRNNTIIGNINNNTLNGDSGNDILTGGGGQDILTGGTGSDKFVYKNLADSLLNNNDRITDFNASIGNDLFLVTNSRLGFVNVGTVTSLDTAGISAKLTNAQFGASYAAQFSFGTRTFIAINDATAGFSPTNDAIIEVTGLTGTLTTTNFVVA